MIVNTEWIPCKYLSNTKYSADTVQAQTNTVQTQCKHKPNTKQTQNKYSAKSVQILCKQSANTESYGLS